MNKKEIAEVKKALSPKRAAMRKIGGGYYEPDGTLTMMPVQDVSGLSEEETEGYRNLFRKCLSGTPGKTLNTVEFPTEAEADGTLHSVLMKMRDSELSDGEAMKQFFSSVGENYIFEDACCLLVMLGDYDVPVKREKDTMEDLEDSEDVYRFLIFAVCPSSLSKPGLTYRKERKQVEETEQIPLLSPPSFGVLFPAFHDRTADIHSMLCYTKKQKAGEEALVEAAFGCTLPASAETVKDGFSKLISDALQEDCTCENVLYIQEKLREKSEDSEDAQEPAKMERDELGEILRDIRDVEDFEETYEKDMGEGSLQIEQVLEPKVKVETPDVSITVKQESANLISMQEVHGRVCIVIDPNGEIEVNGIPVNA